MKKILAMLLATLMIVSLCACGKTASTEGTNAAAGNTQIVDNYKGQYRVGYARVDITPEASVPIAGLGRTSSRMSEGIMDTLYLTCIAVTGTNDETVLMMHIDSQRNQSVKMLSDIEALAAELGMDPHNISITATHTHSGPDCQNTAEPNIVTYNEQLPGKLREVVYAAMNDRVPATDVSYGVIETENCNFTKHYMYEDENGETQYFGDNFGTETINTTTRHTRKADPNLYIMKIERENAKPVVMCNFTGHPHIFTNQEQKEITGDLASYFRTALELQYDCNFMYFNSAGGNVNITTRLGAERRFASYEGGKAGKIFADYAMECLNNKMTKVSFGEVRAIYDDYEYNCNKEGQEYLYVAKSVSAIWNSTGDREAALAVGNGVIRSPYHAGQIVTNANLPDSRTTCMRVFSIADNTAICVSGGEQFSENAEAVRAASPFEFMMYFAYSDYDVANLGYVASEYGWSYTCYETDVATCARGTAEGMVENFNKLLLEMKAEMK